MKTRDIIERQHAPLSNVNKLSEQEVVMINACKTFTPEEKKKKKQKKEKQFPLLLTLGIIKFMLKNIKWSSIYYFYL